MELDSKGLGRLHRVANARDVWTSEAGDFTPWLAENLDVLADELGMSLTLIATEVPVGEFRLDIQAQTPDGQVVIVENQLERTDHRHLGQLLVYASGLEASAVVWVAPRFRDDHRRTLDWLNERTDTGVDFFGVEVSVVQIGDAGPRAPVFEVVARPNDWQKGVKEAGTVGGAARDAGGINAVRQEFFADVLSDVVAQRPGITMPKRDTSNWLSYASGPWGYWTLAMANELRVEADLDSGDAGVNKALFEEFQSAAADWETKVGHPLTWLRQDDKKLSRIVAYHPVGDLADDAERADARAWAVTTAVAMYDAMNDLLRSRGRQLRDEAKQQAAQGASSTDTEAPSAAGFSASIPAEVDDGVSP